jgi:hypothetical protein
MEQGPRQGRPPRSLDGVSESKWHELVEDSLDFDPDELREFLAADRMEVPVRPGFREQLRRKLWAVVRLRYGRGKSDPS